MGDDVAIVYEGGLACEVTHLASGVKVTTEGATAHGGTGEGFSPTDLLAASVGTCMVSAMGMVAARRGIDLKGTRVRVKKRTAAGRIESILVAIDVRADVGGDDRQRLERAALACPVKAALRDEVRVDVHFAWAEKEEG